MGGRGSGRSAGLGITRTKCHELHSIDLAYLRRHGLLRTGVSGQLTWSSRGTKTGSINYRVGERGLHLVYRTRPTGGEWRDVDELIPFTFTAANFSGRRRWFECPTCRRRCRILYGGSYFRCRRCNDLRYESQYEQGFSRATSQAHALRNRLGYEGSLEDPFPPTPKGMHRKTYRRLEERDSELQDRWTAGMMQWLLRSEP